MDGIELEKTNQMSLVCGLAASVFHHLSLE